MNRHAYGDRRSQYGELFLPDGEGPFPVAVVIHGGFWRARYGRKLMRPLCRDLAARGWAAWNLEYRRLGRLSGGGWPATFDDVAAGIDHLAALAAGPAGRDTPAGGRLAPLDLTRLVTIGHSAGGHLAAWAATRPAPRVPVTAVVSQAGVVDLRLAWELRLSNGVVSRLLGGDLELCAQASPAERLPLGVPALLTHGGRDDIVPPVISERFLAAALAAGDACELHVEPDEDHFGHIDPANPLWSAVIDWLARSDPR